MNKFDLIGDIHGHADHLEKLLLKLNYQKHKKGYRHPDRKAIFVGDYIDRGPDTPKVIEIVRSMVEAGDAIALCGNHEHNAICYNIKTDKGFLREHSEKNYKQHMATLEQFKGRQEEYDDMINWLKTLPLFYETEKFRVVHAAWDEKEIKYLRENTKEGILSEEKYDELADKKSDLYKAIEITLKGREAPLPNGKSFFDKDGAERFDIRIKWWLDKTNISLKDISIVKDLQLNDTKFKAKDNYFYDESQLPVFFGHYWLDGEPNLYRNNICCLDFSVAKGGVLCAYRYNGEGELEDKNLVWV